MFEVGKPVSPDVEFGSCFIVVTDMLMKPVDLSVLEWKQNGILSRTIRLGQVSEAYNSGDCVFMYALVHDGERACILEWNYGFTGEWYCTGISAA